MKKKIYLLFCILLIFCKNVNAQIEKNKLLSYPKHEIGFAVGAFPTIGILTRDNGISLFNDAPVFRHTNHIIGTGDNYEKMYHLGSYTFNYNYHYSPKHSIGVSLSWVGKHIDKYWAYYDGGLFAPDIPIDTIDGIGWQHHFTLQGNYRNTYYRKNKISLYFGIYAGITLCIRDKDILPKKTIHHLVGSTGNERLLFFPAIHISAFGVEIGEKYIFNMELGFGTQGLLKAGFKHKF